MTRDEVRDKALDEAKKGGDPQAAVALALVYLGDCVREIDAEPVADALRTIGRELGDANVVASS